MKKTTILLFLFIPVIIYCQNTHEINFRITDTVIIKKNYPYATKVNVEINVRNFQDTFFLYPTLQTFKSDIGIYQCFPFFCRGREIRTPINGFGDHYSTLKLFP